MLQKKLKAIYRPKGPALEYAELALNPYKGCTHGCIYCYNNGRFGKSGFFFSGPQPRDDIVAKVEHDCKILVQEPYNLWPEIVLTFLGDCYQPAEMDLNITRQIITLFVKYNLSFSILTKSAYILRDVDILGPYKRFRPGFSFTTVDSKEAAVWEPGTLDIRTRVIALEQFKKFGKRVWVSLEPVMRIDSTVKVIHALGDLVDFYWIGALNHVDPPEPIDKLQARKQIGAALKKHKRRFRFKRSFDVPG